MNKTFLTPKEADRLLNEYGSPLYVYDEATLRERCRDLKAMMSADRMDLHYSVKANGNIHLLKIIREEGYGADAMSAGEIVSEEAAGFTPDEICMVCNNIDASEMQFAIDRGILICVESLSQLEQYGKLLPGGKVMLRFNEDEGAGHHEKVVTAGKKTKFGIDQVLLPQVKELVEKYSLDVVGIHHHIGSNFRGYDSFIAGGEKLIRLLAEFPSVSIVDFGGGFGVPYEPGEERLDIAGLGKELDRLYEEAAAACSNPNLKFVFEPGRYVVAECGVLLTRALAVKENYGVKYVGTDLGFNVLARPVMYDSYHEVLVMTDDADERPKEVVSVVGNICESGDVIAKNRELPEIHEGDALAVLNAGAYGFSMASNYNCRLRPAEVLIGADGKDRLIRKRDSFEDLLRNF